MQETDTQNPIPPVNVRKIRFGLGLTRVDFANQFLLSVEDVRAWEDGEREPSGWHRSYLALIHHNPALVRDAVRRQIASVTVQPVRPRPALRIVK